MQGLRQSRRSRRHGRNRGTGQQTRNSNPWLTEQLAQLVHRVHRPVARTRQNACTDTPTCGHGKAATTRAGQGSALYPARTGKLTIATGMAQLCRSRGGAAFGTAHAQWCILGLAHALGIEHLVQDVVFTGHQLRKCALQRIHGTQQIAAIHSAGHPLVNQMQAQDFGAKDVLHRKLLLFQNPDAGLHGLKAGMDGHAHPHRQTRGQNLVFHHIVAQQLERQGAGDRFGRFSSSHGRFACRLLQCLSTGLHPGRLVGTKAQLSVMPDSHLSVRGNRAGLLGKKFVQLLGNTRQALADAMHPTQTRLPAQLWLGRRRAGGSLRRRHFISVRRPG